MKFFILAFTIPFFAIGQPKTASELVAKGFKKFPIESAEINYEITGDAEGSEKMVFTDFGWNSLREQTLTFELYGIASKQSIYEITDGDFVYRLNEKDSTYQIKTDTKWSRQASYKTPQQTSEAILFSMGGQQVADSTLLNKKCQVWTFEGKSIQEMWIWNGVVLKRKALLGDKKIITTAKEINLDISPNPILFTIPEFYSKAKEE